MNTFAKGTGPKAAKYAHGGEVISSRSRFMKAAPDPFRDDDEIVHYEKSGKGGTLSKLSGDSKSLKPIKPRSKASEEASESGAERRREAKAGEE